MNAPIEQLNWIESGDGTPVALHALGGSGPPLIICHATGFHARTYLPLIATWTSDFTVFGLDVRGHGASQIAATDSFVWEDFGADLLAAAEYIGEPLRAFGHSMGGTTVLLAEAARAGTIEKAWLYEPIIVPSGVGPRNSFMAEHAARRRAIFATKAEALARYASRPPLNVLRADALAAYVEHGFIDQEDGTVRIACQPVHEAMTFQTARISSDRLTEITTPITIAQGYTIPGQPSAADFAEDAASAMGNATVVKYDEYGHFGPLEAPTQFAADVADALR